MNTVEEAIDALVDELGAENAKKCGEWNGYTVYEPQYFQTPVIGYPYVILVKGDEARISTIDESLEYLDYMNG